LGVGGRTLQAAAAINESAAIVFFIELIFKIEWF